ncbi:MAG: hypothetical protein KF891_15310 [Rhizobacter sp.]|nr:hypothetical protein [Rhizobacter sp.]
MKAKRNTCLALVVLSVAAASQAQDQPSALSVSLGVKAWNTEWTTFGYDTNGAGQTVLTQVAANDKLIFVPLVSLRYRDFIGSVSGYTGTDYDFIGGGTNTRRELDANVGYFVLPGVALTLGYKKVGQKAATDNYELAGPVLGASATAPLGRDVSLYGAFGLGRMKSTGSSTVKFDADYRLTELGLAYTLATQSVAKAVSFTLGYRTQVLSSKQALGDQDGRDLTQGVTLGVVAAF